MKVGEEEEEKEEEGGVSVGLMLKSSWFESVGSATAA